MRSSKGRDKSVFDYGLLRELAARAEAAGASGAGADVKKTLDNGDEVSAAEAAGSGGAAPPQFQLPLPGSASGSQWATAPSTSPVVVLFGEADGVVAHSNKKSNNLMNGFYAKPYSAGGVGADCDVIGGLGHQFLTDTETEEQNESVYRAIRKVVGVATATA